MCVAFAIVGDLKLCNRVSPTVECKYRINCSFFLGKLYATQTPHQGYCFMPIIVTNPDLVYICEECDLRVLWRWRGSKYVASARD